MRKTKNETCVILILLAITSLFSFKSYSQTFNVNGKLTTSDTKPVRYASVIFVDQSDPLKNFSAITDTLGNYWLSIITSVENDKPIVPETIELAQNYPNPFTTETTIPYKLKKESDVTVRIYNILGQEVKIFKQGLETTGIYGIKWDGKNSFGIKATPGIYFCQLIAGKESQVKKMLFGFGNNNSESILNNRTDSFNKKVGYLKCLSLVSESYKVKIENTDSTSPTIETTQLNNIIIQRDTTMNFIVNEANDYSLCYQRPTENNSMEIYLNNIKGTHPKDISNWIYEDRSNEWSPDGDYIVFESLGMPTYIRLYDTKKDTTIYLTAGPDTLSAGNPRWTPDSKHIVYNGYWKTYMISTDGSNNRELPHNPDYFYMDSYTFLYQAVGGIYMSNIDGTYNEFVFNPKTIGQNYVGPKDFNPYNHDILILADPTPLITDLLVTYNVDTKKLDTIAVADSGWLYTHPKFSNDYSKIAVLKINYSYQEQKICILEDGKETEIAALTNCGMNEGDEMFGFYPFSFSSDNKYLAYTKIVFGIGGGWEDYLYVIEIETKKITFIDMGSVAKWNPQREH